MRNYDSTLGNSGGLDNTNRTLAGTAGLHNRDKFNPITENLGGHPSDAGPGYGLSSYNDQYVEKPIEGNQQIYNDVLSSANTRNVTVLVGEGTYGTKVKGDVSSNFGGVTFEEKK